MASPSAFYYSMTVRVPVADVHQVVFPGADEQRLIDFVVVCGLYSMRGPN